MLCVPRIVGVVCAEQAVLVQYVILRADLWKGLGWPLGSIIAQACHAATAALWLSRHEAVSQEYCAEGNLDHMHKVLPHEICASFGADVRFVEAPKRCS